MLFDDLKLTVLMRHLGMTTVIKSVISAPMTFITVCQCIKINESYCSLFKVVLINFENFTQFSSLLWISSIVFVL